MKTSQHGYFDGIMAALVAVAEITGQQKLDGMSDREWEMIHEINLKLTEMAATAASRLAAS